MPTNVLEEKSNASSDSQHQYCSYIGGEWVHTGEQLQVVDPSTGNSFATVSTIRQEHVSAALSIAENLLPRVKAKLQCRRTTCIGLLKRAGGFTAAAFPIR